MPVILAREVRRRWFGEEDSDPEELLAPLRPHPAELMQAYPVGIRHGNVRNNGPALLDRVILAA